MIAPSARGNSTLTVHRPLGDQASKVRDYLMRHGSITPKDAIGFVPPIYRLAARVMELREIFGESAIVTEYEAHEGGRHARYVLALDADHQSDLFA